MNHPRPILAALDLEGDSEAVLMRARQLAEAHAAKLVLLHAIEAGSLGQAAAASGCGEDSLREALERQAREAIAALLDGATGPDSAEVRVEFGPAHAAITNVAEQLGAALVVLGPGARARALRGRVIGSTVDRVARIIQAHLLVVRTRPEHPYRKVTVAVDFSARSGAALRAARAMAPAASLRLVHAVHVPDTFQQAMLRAGATHADIASFRARMADKARADLAALAAGITGAGRVATRVLANEPGAALVRLSKGRGVDLLAMGADGRGAVRQALLGSVTRRLLAEAGCDVLVAVRCPGVAS